MSPGYRDPVLVEAAATAHRGRTGSGRILPSAAWRDLDPRQREDLFELQMESRRLERALDPEGVSATVRAVLSRLGA